MTPEVFGYNPSLKPVAYDPAHAKRLLAEAGYPNGVDIPFTYTSGRYPQDKEISQAVAAQLAQVGVRTQQIVLESGEFFNQILHQQLRGIYYLGLLPAPDANFVYSFYLCDAPFSFYCNKDFDVLVKRAALTVDTKQRLRTYNLVSRIVVADPIGVFLFSPQDLYGSSKRLKDWQPYTSQYLYFAKSSVQ
jgi:peptide/nickel transport system substrate-binding protein